MKKNKQKAKGITIFILFLLILLVIWFTNLIIIFVSIINFSEIRILGQRTGKRLRKKIWVGVKQIKIKTKRT